MIRLFLMEDNKPIELHITCRQDVDNMPINAHSVRIYVSECGIWHDDCPSNACSCDQWLLICYLQEHIEKMNWIELESNLEDTPKCSTLRKLKCKKFCQESEETHSLTHLHCSNFSYYGNDLIQFEFLRFRSIEDCGSVHARVMEIYVERGSPLPNVLNVSADYLTIVFKPFFDDRTLDCTNIHKNMCQKLRIIGPCQVINCRIPYIYSDDETFDSFAWIEDV